MRSLTASTGPVFSREWLAPGGSKDVVLCVHGSESHSGWFHSLAAALTAHGVSVCAFDRPGWGNSAGARGCLVRAVDAERQLIEFATALRSRFERIHLAGLSWGGLLACFTVLRTPQLVESLTLIAPGICFRNRLSWTARLRIALFGLTRLDSDVQLWIKPEEFADDPSLRDWITHDPLRTTKVNAGFCYATLRMRRSVQRQLRRNGGRLPIRARLLIAGNDTVIDNAATRILFSGTPLTVFENAAHSLVLESPGRVAGEIMRQVKPRTAA